VPAIWDRLLGPDERAALRPGRPDDLDRRPDVLVVGGGAIGLAVAAAGVRAQLGRVVVLEREPGLASAASGSNAGAIAPDMHLLTDSPEFVAFGRAGRTLYRELDAEWGGAIGLWPTRWLNIFPPGASPRATRQAPDIPAADRTPPEHTALDAAQVKALEPDVRLPAGGSASLVGGQFGVNPQRLAGALAAHAGQVATGVAMRDVTIRGDRVVTVHTTAGDFTPGALVVATGLVPPPWGRTVPQRWVKGHMVAVGPGRWRLGSVLGGPLGGGTPLPGGRVVCGGTFDLDDQTAEIRPEVADQLAADLAAVLPAAAEAPITDRWYCFRPSIEGRQPVVDRLPGVANGWFAGGHFTTGIMMAAATGAAVATWIAGSARPDSVKTFTLPLDT
jgi:glycine oxidase